MNKLKTHGFGSIVLALMLYFISTAAGAAPFGIMGPINSIDATTINVMDTPLLLSPTVKVYDTNGKKIRLEALHPGVMVQVQTLDLGSKKLADSIRLLK